MSLSGSREKDKFLPFLCRYLSRKKVVMLILGSFALLAFLIGIFSVNRAGKTSYTLERFETLNLIRVLSFRVRILHFLLLLLQVIGDGLDLDLVLYVTFPWSRLWIACRGPLQHCWCFITELISMRRVLLKLNHMKAPTLVCKRMRTWLPNWI